MIKACGVHFLRVVRIHTVGPEADPDIVAQPLGVEHFKIPFGWQCAGTTMYDAAIECDTVAGTHFPAGYAEFVSVGINIREWFPLVSKMNSVYIRLLVGFNAPKFC